MKRIPLGRGGPTIGAVGYGAMSFTNFYGPATDDGSKAVLDACLDLGIDHIDTSNVYGMGRSETVIGEWLAARGGECPFTIATKAGITRDADGNRKFDNSRAHLEAELDKSLAKLGLDAVDLFYVHRRDAATPVEETAEALKGLIDAGKCKAVGFSEIAPSTLRRAHAVCPVAAVQSEYSLSTRAPEMGLLQTCAELGVALVAFSPVGRGLLTDRPPSREKAAGLDFLKGNPRFMSPNIEANLAASARFQALAAEMGHAAATLAIAWLLAKGDHVVPIPGTRSATHLAEVAKAGDVALSAEEMARIEAVLPVGWAYGDRYNDGQWVGPERYS